MSPFHPYGPPSDLELLTRSMALWPDPFDSPEVPGELTLRAYLAGEKLDPEIRLQIEESVDCRRALTLLREEMEKKPETDYSGMLAALLKAAEKHPVPPKARFESTEAPAPQMEAVELRPSPGDLFATSPRVEQWDGTKLTHRHTFRPLSVLILDDGHPVPWGDTVFRGAACSPVDLWPPELRADDESVADFGRLGEFVIHWWLNYPVSRSQLTRKIGEVRPASTGESLSPAQFNAAGLEPDPDDEPFWLERDQLHARAAYLGANAHARRLAAEEGSQAEETLFAQQESALAAIILLFPVFQQRARAAAASGKVVCPMAVIPQDQLQADEYRVQEEAKSPSQDGDATVVCGPLRDQDRVYMEWTLYPPQPEGIQVLVINLREKRLLGEAQLSSDGSTAILSDAPWENLKAYAENPEKLNELGVAVIKDVR